MKHFWILLLFPFFLVAKSPQAFQQELDEAEKQFEQAKEMFNPWYTGPLLTPSASMVPPGLFIYQPYAYVTTNYAQFNEDRHAAQIPRLVSLSNLNVMQTGISNYMDILLIAQGIENWQNHKNGGGFGDITVTLGWPLHTQTLYTPQVKLTVRQTFPSGSFNHLSASGLDGVGAGSFQTTFGLGTSKVLFWSYTHPFNARLFLGYTVPTTVHVAGYNSYGGGEGTRGKVRPGNSFSADLGMELSLSQRWVLATDVVYSYANRTSFHGRPGVSATGATAVVGKGASDNLSLAPALEYNWSNRLGVIGGVWFSVYGRNSLDFATAMLSVCWIFQPS